MQQILTVERATMLLRHYGGWFGPPALMLRGTYIDGRTRIEAVRAMNLPNSVFKSNTFSGLCDADAARFLMLAGHHARALQLVPEALRGNLTDIAVFCDLSREDVALAFPRVRVTQMKAHTTPRRRQAIEKMAQLLRAGEQSADGKVEVSRIREALSPWLQSAAK